MSMGGTDRVGRTMMCTGHRSPRSSVEDVAFLRGRRRTLPIQSMYVFLPPLFFPPDPLSLDPGIPIQPPYTSFARLPL